MNRDTLFARSKRNGGFLAGRNHPILGTEDGMARMQAIMAAKTPTTPGPGEDPDAGEEEQETPSDRDPDMPVKTEDEDEVVGGGEKAAPHYAAAQGMDDCAGCMHYDRGDSECERFEFVAKPDYVCDDFKPEGDAENADMTQNRVELAGNPAGRMQQ
jgi:hypothetical protein